MGDGAHGDWTRWVTAPTSSSQSGGCRSGGGGGGTGKPPGTSNIISPGYDFQKSSKENLNWWLLLRDHQEKYSQTEGTVPVTPIAPCVLRSYCRTFCVPVITAPRTPWAGGADGGFSHETGYFIGTIPFIIWIIQFSGEINRKESLFSPRWRGRSGLGSPGNPGESVHQVVIRCGNGALLLMSGSQWGQPSHERNTIIAVPANVPERV